MRLLMKFSALLIVFFVIGTVSAQSAPSASQPDRIEQLQQQVADAKARPTMLGCWSQAHSFS